MSTPTIYDIKHTTLDKSPYFFNRNTMRAFGQTLKSFKVVRSPGGRIFIYAAIKDNYAHSKLYNRIMGYTFREYKDNDLITVRNDDDSMYYHNTLEDVLNFIRSH